MIKPKENLIGRQFGRLTVIRQDEDYVSPKGKHAIKWVCQCSCKNKTIVSVRDNHLRDGTTVSCGCYAKEKDRKYNNFDLSGEFGICYLNNGKQVLFDLEDYNLIKDYYWQENKYGYVVSQIQNNGIITGLRINRLIMGLESGDKRIVDHIKHNLLDNRKSQLRIVTYSQNGQNQKINSKNTSGYTGVCWSKTHNKWRAHIKLNGKQIFLGYHTDINNAINARRNAEEKYFGEYSYKNSTEELNEQDKQN